MANQHSQSQLAVVAAKSACCGSTGSAMPAGEITGGSWGLITLLYDGACLHQLQVTAK